MFVTNIYSKFDVDVTLLGYVTYGYKIHLTNFLGGGLNKDDVNIELELSCCYIILVSVPILISHAQTQDKLIINHINKLTTRIMCVYIICHVLPPLHRAGPASSQNHVCARPPLDQSPISYLFFLMHPRISLLLLSEHLAMTDFNGDGSSAEFVRYLYIRSPTKNLYTG